MLYTRVAVDNAPKQLNEIGNTTITANTKTVKVMGNSGVVMKTSVNTPEDKYKNNQIVKINMTGI